MGTAPSPARNWKVSLNNSSFFSHFLGNVSCSGVPIQRDYVHHLIAFSVSDESSYVTSTVVQSFLLH